VKHAIKKMKKKQINFLEKPPFLKKKPMDPLRPLRPIEPRVGIGRLGE
jgi:hypothetical protein